MLKKLNSCKKWNIDKNFR